MPAIANRNLRLLIATLVAPISPGSILFCFAVFGRVGEGVWALGLSAMVGYPAMLILGIPGYFALRKLGWNRAWSYGALGALIGLAVASIIFGRVIANKFALSNEISIAPSIATLVLSAMLGALAGSVFWMISRPDRDLSSDG